MFMESCRFAAICPKPFRAWLSMGISSFTACSTNAAGFAARAGNSYEKRSAERRWAKVAPNTAGAGERYHFSKAMENPGIISTHGIVNTYLPMDFRHLKIKDRGLGSALVPKFTFYYLTKLAYQ